MNTTPSMNDNDLFAAARESLAALRDSLAEVRMERPVETLVATGRARRTRRALAVRAAVACVAVTAAAVITVTHAVGVSPARRSAVGIQARTAALVVWRLENALAGTNVVLQQRYTFSPAFPVVTQWSYRGNFRVVQSGLMPPAAVAGLPWAQGRQSWGDGTVATNGKRAYVQVDYRRREWYATSAQDFVPGGCSTDLVWVEYGAEMGDAADWARYVRQALSCGKFKVAGRAPVNGKETIEVTGSMVQPHWIGRWGLQVDVTMYVDPSTYLPVRMIWSNRTHAADGKPLRGTVREEIRLLPPTPANVARASVTIPGGFRRVSGDRPPFGGPIFPLTG